MSAALPPWVLQLVYELDRAEDEHPKFYRYARFVNGVHEYEPVETCYLDRLLNLVPGDVLAGVRVAAAWQPKPPPD